MSPPDRLKLPLIFAALHGADQLALAALPLIATLSLGAGPGLTGALVAAQGMAWLLVALPAGVLADRMDRRRLLAAGGLLAALGFGLALPLAGQPVLLGLAGFLGASGVVAAALASFALLPSLVERPALPAANARLELGRALATLAAAPIAGILATRGLPQAGLGLAALAGLVAALLAWRLPAPTALPRATQPGLGAAVAEGARFVLAQPLLRAIALAAIAWNAGFFALMAVAVPLALGPLGLDAATAGLALGAYGAGLVLGALAAPRISTMLPLGQVLLSGPGLSVLGMAALLLAPGFVTLALCMGLLGFGPMLWQVAQTSLRQAVTPMALLGRVGAVMQVAVFGVRPLGALIGGGIATGFGLPAALWLAMLGFGLSLLAVALSPLAPLRALPSLDQMRGLDQNRRRSAS
ncbi:MULTISPECIES: MFS transporter [Roseomonadaceae]|uniref:MFS transporter n=1 Tax=Falsiroseomonas oleicola TaxID=2801474 RepID=A0ABS6HEY4_9PROT|nr:MFS transporter [Roseomonas oleicola]MBU8546876.1 MFS transporter [Roseomonas oleicola]